jgi:hypothetical protein
MWNWSISASALAPRPESLGANIAAQHAAAVLLRGHDQVVAHRHLAEHLQGLEGAAHAEAVERQGAELVTSWPLSSMRPCRV